jgi:hypothetical protein
MENQGFGKAKYDRTGGTTYKKRKTLALGSNVRRVMPPFGSLAAKGQWAIFVKQHFGYFAENPSNPDKPIPKPFACVEKRKKTGTEYMTIQECAACTELFDKKRQLEAITVTLPKGETTPESEFLASWTKDHNLDKKWLLNTMLENGEFELTAISNTCYWRLDELFKKLRNEEGIDPIDIEQGVWINFERTLPNGSKQLRDADDSVTPVYETIVLEGRRFKDIKKAPLSEEVLQRALTECVDLGKQTTEISVNQVNQLVASGGSPEEVAAIFGLAQPVQKEEESAPPAPAPRTLTPPKAAVQSRRDVAMATPPTSATLVGTPVRTETAVAAGTSTPVTPKTPSQLTEAKAFADSLFGTDE